MKRPPKSKSIQKARKERNRLTFRWIIAGLSGVAGVLLGGLVYYWIQEMNPPPYRPANVATGAESFALWWFEFAHRWQLVFAAATSGTFGVLLPALSFLERRKEVATRVFGTGIAVIGINGVALAWDGGFSAWEIVIPAFLSSFLTMLLLGTEGPPVTEDPLIRKHVPTSIPPSPASEHDPNAAWSLRHDSTKEEFVEDTVALYFLPGTLTFRSIFESLGIVLVFLLLHFILPEALPQRALLLSVGAAACIFLNWTRFERKTKRQMAAASTEKLELSFPITEDWELDEEHLTHRMGDTETKLSWDTLESFQVLKNGFHMTFRESGASYIPYRAFADNKEQRRWGARFRSHLAQKADS
ncbi:MAG: hypothetical protein QM477_08190 [Planctomycetota bacterium]